MCRTGRILHLESTKAFDVAVRLKHWLKNGEINSANNGRLACRATDKNDCVTREPKACVREKQGAVRLPLLFGRLSLVYNRFKHVHLSFYSNRKLKESILKIRERIIDVTFFEKQSHL